MASIVLAVIAFSLLGFSSDLSITDEQITSAIRSRLAMDGRIDPSLIVVKAEQGRITLSGMVKTLEEKYLADTVASSTITGVQAIVNNLIVKPAIVTKDAAVKEAVERELQGVPALRGKTLTVGVHDGVVKLEGLVRQPLERRAAQRATEQVVGATGVINLIKVARESRPDRDIEKDVALYLKWSPLVNIDAIELNVHNGVVTLKGTIDQLGHRYALEEDLEKIHGVMRVDVSELAVKKRA